MPSLSSIAIRVHNVEAMLTWQVQFREVGPFGIRSQFGEVNGIMLKKLGKQQRSFLSRTQSLRRALTLEMKAAGHFSLKPFGRILKGEANAGL